MKYRQAKKIVKKRFNGCIYCDPSLNKAIIVYVHHRKKTTKWYEKNGTIKELRHFYEKI